MDIIFRVLMLSCAALGEKGHRTYTYFIHKLLEICITHSTGCCGQNIPTSIARIQVAMSVDKQGQMRVNGQRCMCENACLV